MIQTTASLFDVVALLEDVPEKRLRRGDVGTIVEELAAGVVEVEFTDDQGRTITLAPLPLRQLLPLRSPGLFRKTA